MKFKTETGRIINGDYIRNQEEIDNIRRRGFYGETPEIGKVSEYLGPSDGGFAVYNEDELELI